jgi:hypothetical protein
MKTKLTLCALALILATGGGQSQAIAADAVPVTVDNYVRAESDLYFSGVIKDFGFGKVGFNREMTPVDEQAVIRMNRVCPRARASL